jgi:hypothetical protein
MKLRDFFRSKGAGALTGGNIIVGDINNTPAEVSVSGDVTISNAGVTTIGGGKVTEAMQVLANNTTQNVSITKHGYAPIAPNDATKFLDGTGAWSTPSGAGDMLATLLNSEVAITAGGTTATISKMHKVSGSTTFTFPLPAASGNTGKLLGVHCLSTYTGICTLDGNSSETIDGALTRPMWAGESAILLCDGSNWFKVGGYTIPMTASATRATDQTSGVTNYGQPGTWSPTVMTAQTDGPAIMWNSGSGVLVCKRTGNYNVGGFNYPIITTRASPNDIIVGYTTAIVNGTNLSYYQQSTFNVSTVGGAAPAMATLKTALTTGDTVTMGTFTTGDTNGVWKLLGAGGSLITITEIPAW